MYSSNLTTPYCTMELVVGAVVHTARAIRDLQVSIIAYLSLSFPKVCQSITDGDTVPACHRDTMILIVLQLIIESSHRAILK